MAVDFGFVERHSDNELTVNAVVDGPTTRSDLFSDLMANIPLTWDLLNFSKVESAERVPTRDDLWRVELQYAAAREKQDLRPGDVEFQWNTAERSITHTFSIASQVFDSSGENTAGYSDARIIGWNEAERRADGVTETEPMDAFGWRISVDWALATDSWRRQISALKNTVCDDVFFTYPIGEVLMKDASGGMTGEGVYTLDLQFLRGPNPGTINVGGITVADVEFWHVLDIDDQELVLQNGIIVPKVRRVKVHRTKEYADWSILKTFLGV